MMNFTQSTSTYFIGIKYWTVSDSMLLTYTQTASLNFPAAWHYNGLNTHCFIMSIPGYECHKCSSADGRTFRVCVSLLPGDCSDVVWPDDSTPNYAGLIVSDCSLTFRTADAHLMARRITIRAVPTPGSNSRLLSIGLAPATATCAQSPWQAYQVQPIQVSHR